jgi:hypothetical protein
MDRPIIFSGPMVQALLAGRKTQTRRLATSPLRHCHPGDRLYVREAFSFPNDQVVIYRANWREDAIARGLDNIPADDTGIRWTPSIHMPRWASRLTLTVTEVRHQCLRDISEADARDEGALWVPGHGEITPTELRSDPGYSNFMNCLQGFEVLWNSLHTKPGETWADEPEVVALTFTVERRNIDAARPEPAPDPSPGLPKTPSIPEQGESK